MKLEIMAARALEAENRITAAANALSNQLQLPWPSLTQTHRDGQVQQLWRNEALAVFLETAVARLTLPPVAADDDTTVGYPPLTAEQAEKAFGKADLVSHLIDRLETTDTVLEPLTKAELVALMALSVEDALAALESNGPAD
ncbi:MAG: hypothetical protein H6658_02105 [Ardenticatenaceae bacterium]|nr:hypothetical protein [Ardenticatenaceae bacterium]